MEANHSNLVCKTLEGSHLPLKRGQEPPRHCESSALSPGLPQEGPFPLLSTGPLHLLFLGPGAALACHFCEPVSFFPSINANS